MVQQLQWFGLDDVSADLGMPSEAVLELCEHWRERRDRGLPYIKADLVLGEWQISASSLRRYKMGRTQEIQQRKAEETEATHDLSRRQKAVLMDAAAAYQEGRSNGKLMEYARKFSTGQLSKGSQTKRTIESLCRHGYLDEISLKSEVVYMINAAGFRILRQIGEW